MILWISMVHIVFLCLAWLVGYRLDIRRRIAVALTAPQKTEGMAIAILAIIFKGANDQGLYVLPVATYHSVQMLVAASLIPLFKRIIHEHDAVVLAQSPLCSTDNTEC